MTQPRKGPTAPLSPVLLAGLLARPLPHQVLQPAFSAAIRQMFKKHPDVFERLIALNSPRFLIDPIDLPFSFVMDTNPEKPSLDIIRTNQDENELNTQAAIRGPLVLLIQLLEGRIDGDSLFFSRDLIVEGDTECVLALRNAVDGADIQVHEDLLSFFGPFAAPIDLAAKSAGAIFKRFTHDLDIISQATLAPLHRKFESQAATLHELEESVADLKKQLRRRSGKIA
jgi:O2-independent ubiquinone biosynthesis accessory factor UbiT